MGKKTTKANNTFLLGSLILMVLLLVVIVLFLFAAFKIYDRKKEGFSHDRYEITLGQSAQGRPISVYMNDSLLFSGTPASDFTLSVGRFAEESALLVVDMESDAVSTLPLPEGSARVTVIRSGDGFAIGKED